MKSEHHQQHHHHRQKAIKYLSIILKSSLQAFNASNGFALHGSSTKQFHRVIKSLKTIAIFLGVSTPPQKKRQRKRSSNTPKLFIQMYLWKSKCVPQFIAKIAHGNDTLNIHIDWSRLLHVMRERKPKSVTSTKLLGEERRDRNNRVYESQ